jgi:uncharacterized 2Fe-2S/4Fe-4S cluster protein (DUF4445 family)
MNVYIRKGARLPLDYEVLFLPDQKKVKVRPNTNVLDASRRAGVRIPTRCGGKAGCLMCKIIVPSEERDHCSAPEPKEIRKLGTSMMEQGYRLSCQTRITNHIKVMIPEDPLKAAIRKQLEAARNRESDDFI